MAVAMNDDPIRMEEFLHHAESDAFAARERRSLPLQYTQIWVQHEDGTEQLLVRRELSEDGFIGDTAVISEDGTYVIYPDMVIMPMISGPYSEHIIKTYPDDGQHCYENPEECTEICLSGPHPDGSKTVPEEFLDDMVARWQLRQGRLLLRDMDGLLDA